MMSSSSIPSDNQVYRFPVSVKGVIYSPTPFSEVIHSSEYKAVGLFCPEEIPTLRMPEGYKHSIQTWVNFLNHPEM